VAGNFIGSGPQTALHRRALRQRHRRRSRPQHLRRAGSKPGLRGGVADCTLLTESSKSERSFYFTMGALFVTAGIALVFPGLVLLAVGTRSTVEPSMHATLALPKLRAIPGGFAF
jgi:hypothetical protein